MFTKNDWSIKEDATVFIERIGRHGNIDSAKRIDSRLGRTSSIGRDFSRTISGFIRSQGNQGNQGKAGETELGQGKSGNL